MTTDWDAIVIGAGPAGSVAALRKNAGLSKRCSVHSTLHTTSN